MHVCSFDLLNFTNVGEKRVFAWSYHWIKSVDFMEPGEFCNLSLLFYCVNISLLYYYINTGLLLQTTVNYATTPWQIVIAANTLTWKRCVDFEAKRSLVEHVESDENLISQPMYAKCCTTMLRRTRLLGKHARNFPGNNCQARWLRNLVDL